LEGPRISIVSIGFLMPPDPCSYTEFGALVPPEVNGSVVTILEPSNTEDCTMVFHLSKGLYGIDAVSANLYTYADSVLTLTEPGQYSYYYTIDGYQNI
jgi:hypothetical protein